ncbi:hypothetical protein GCM10011505_43330 [Tistrella bauzanensis]|uniref:SxtJ n=1 Tax=Tistrella bauzanensis TaxID=657419 RepID=A0ABQ1J4R0_9PROT|nr:SxtJ family membrane protein [Tistrella bauzanensis]GGB57789.1 hypothetical protein GCM10011505_43330 [Tistrella bauzanensis]
MSEQPATPDRAPTSDAPPAASAHAGPTDRGFGLVFTVVFTGLGLMPLLSGRMPNPWLLAAAAIILALALLRPRVLAPANRLWMAFGRVLHRVISPVMLAVIYFGVITPGGLMLRHVFRRNSLRLGFRSGVASYWVRPDPADAARHMFKDQF